MVCRRREGRIELEEQMDEDEERQRHKDRERKGRNKKQKMRRVVYLRKRATERTRRRDKRELWGV